MQHNLKYTTHISFIHTIHTTLRYIADFSYLKPIHMHKKVKGYLKFLFYFFEFSIYTHPQKFSFTPKPKWVNGKRN